MVRLITTVVVGAVLSAGLALIPPPAFAAPPSAPSAGTVMLGRDTTGLIAMLPWWRADESRSPDPGRFASPILTACDLWLGFPFATTDAQSPTVRLAAAQYADASDFVANRIRIIDPGELNEIDLTAPDEPQGVGRSWLYGLLAILGGALAAISAARHLIA